MGRRKGGSKGQWQAERDVMTKTREIDAAGNPIVDSAAAAAAPNGPDVDSKEPAPIGGPVAAGAGTGVVRGYKAPFRGVRKQHAGVSSAGPRATAEDDDPNRVRTCVTCLMDRPAAQFVACHPDNAMGSDSQHLSCIDCIQQWVRSQLDQHVGVVPSSNAAAAGKPTDAAAAIQLKCPRCPQPIAQRSLYAACSGWPNTRELCAKLDRAMAGVSFQSDYQPCPRSGCLGGGFVGAAEKGSDAAMRVECPQCHHCFEYRREGEASARSSAAWKLRNSKPCPQCGAPVEKNGGCPHMACTRCKHSYCWVCLKPYRDAHQQCMAANNREMRWREFRENFWTYVAVVVFVCAVLYVVYVASVELIARWNAARLTNAARAAAEARAARTGENATHLLLTDPEFVNFTLPLVDDGLAGATPGSVYGFVTWSFSVWKWLFSAAGNLCTGCIPGVVIGWSIAIGCASLFAGAARPLQPSYGPRRRAASSLLDAERTRRALCIAAMPFAGLLLYYVLSRDLAEWRVFWWMRTTLLVTAVAVVLYYTIVIGLAVWERMRTMCRRSPGRRYGQYAGIERAGQWGLLRE